MQKSVVIQRILLAFAAGILIGLAVSELTFLFVGETARKPKTIAIVIPPGTADLVARGEQPPTLPQDMTFVVGDILSVENKDSVDHQLGPLWIPPGASGQLNLGEVASLAFDCSFQPSKVIGLDVREPLTLSTRLYGILYAGLPLGILIALYFVIMPETKKTKK